MPPILTRAIVLRRVDYRDNARMVTLLSPTLGLLSVSARGCRSPKSVLANATELFFCGDYQLYQRGEHCSISQAQRIDSFYNIRTDYDKFRHGAYWLSLTEALSQPAQSHAALFEHLIYALTCLCQGANPDKWTLAFAFGAMTIEGYRPALEQCAICGQSITGNARFSAQHGGCICQKCPVPGKSMTADTRELITIACLGNAIRAFVAYDPPQDALTAALKLLAPYADARLEKRIRASVTST